VVSIGNRSLVAPDNGLAAAVSEATRAVVLDWRRMGVDEPSRTFHGRDLFAPAAARLARGPDVHDFGDEIAPGTLVPCPLPEPVSTVSGCAGKILHVDRFGNLVTNVRCEDEPEIASVTWGTGRTGRRVRTYADAQPDEVVLLEGSAGYLELAINCGSAAEATSLERGDTVIFNKLGIRN
jgi:S-adenosylmethionine hydrolase